MSWEAWGSGDDPIDPDDLYRHGWASDENCEVWWREWDPDTKYTFEEAIQAYMEWLVSD
jgi:hypothetical protein